MAESIPEKDQFLTAYPNYVLRETVTYPNGGVSRFYDDGVDMVIIDDKICSCRDGEQIFPYTLITDKQNHYMKIYRRVFRFLGFDPETIEKCLRKSRQEVLHSTKKISERGEYADSSPLELLFEQNFTDVYGMRALKYLQKEFRISDEDGNNYFLDYLVDTADSRVAIEENGIHYHHPQLIGIEGYRKQLRKQNTCALWGLKLYRFSTEDCRFKDRIEDDIRSYLGKDTGGFREAGLLLERKTELYEHQEISLAQIEERREKGIRAFLIVLPTAAGKSRIVEEDIQKFAAGKEQLCNHAPGKHHLSCDDLITYCSTFGWIRFSENILSLADDLIQLVEDNNQTNNYLIQSTVNFLFDADIFSINMFYYDSVQQQYRFKNESFPLKLSSVRNVLISQGFLCVDRGVTGSRFYVSPEYESLVASQCIRKRKAISLEQLKKRLKSDELAGEKAELFVVKYEKKRLGVEGENKVKRISEIDVTAGYDIVSANSPNSTVANRFIEVKAVSENGFYWSKNEYDIAKLLAADYYLYLVDLSKIDDDNYEPDIIHNPVQHIMENNLWLVEPQSYHIQKVKF